MNIYRKILCLTLLLLEVAWAQNTKSYDYQNTQTGAKTLYTWYGQGAKKWSLQQFQDKRLISSTEVDDNLATWTFTSFYASGNKKIEIHCKGDSIPTYSLYNAEGGKIRSYQTWEFNMFGESILPKSPYKLLNIFPRYTGFLFVKEEKGDASDFEGDEWVEGETTSKKKTKKHKEQVEDEYFEMESPVWGEIFHMKKGLNKRGDWCIAIHRNGKINFQAYSRKKFEPEYAAYKSKQIRKQIPLIKLEDESYEMWESSKTMKQYFSSKCNVGHYGLPWQEIHRMRYELRARQAMNLALPLMKGGNVNYWVSPTTTKALMYANHKILLDLTDCTGIQTPYSWIQELRTIDLPKTDDCKEDDLVLYYDCHCQKMRMFFREKWTLAKEKDSTLSCLFPQNLKLHYKKGELARVDFLKSNYRSLPNKKERAFIKSILREMPIAFKQQKFVLEYPLQD